MGLHRFGRGGCRLDCSYLHTSQPYLPNPSFSLPRRKKDRNRMDFVSTIISPIAESLKKHLEFLVYSTEYVEDMKKKMDQLNATESDVQEKGIESHRKRKWIEDVKVLNEKSNSIEAVGGINVLKRYKVGKQSFGILEEIKDLENRESKIVFTHAQKPLAELGSTSAGLSTSALVPMGTQNNFESRDLIDDTYPSYLLHPYHHLQSFELRSDARVKAVLFETDGPLFLYGLPTIQVLKLNGLEEMSHVWKCNWKKLSIPHHQPLHASFHASFMLPLRSLAMVIMAIGKPSHFITISSPILWSSASSSSSEGDVSTVLENNIFDSALLKTSSSEGDVYKPVYF
ncbi:hypothetical protein L1987_06312 [Smallanthus sonchifolius]|uniref:Uncharacterized protein n=1 Tax=Smallanthus sonchifolius TaxID=185202 RepID=A0ACB9JXS6_9ASTR|nr:hypothetical protein L1987_06312 [Smallanthus sonchifolius]